MRIVCVSLCVIVANQAEQLRMVLHASPLRSAKLACKIYSLFQLQSFQRKRMPLRYAILAICFYVCHGFAYCAPKEVVLLIGEALDEKGSPRALAPARRALLSYLEQALNVKFEIRMYPWARVESNAANGEGIVLGLSKNVDRLARFHFSEAAYANNLWLVTRSDSRFSFNSIQDLKGKSIGAVRGFSYGPEFDLAKNKVFHVEEDISSRSSRLKKLLSKRMDALLVYQLSTDSAEEVEAGINAFMANEVKDMALPAKVSFSVLPKPLQVDFIYFCIAKNKDDGLIARINAALANGRKTGDLARALKGP
ncbi:substrate-binding periplasmic protein [Undibacterium terreum]|uniref:substrate-binding periplasmic protein n=1 Tax=Undibacterium terreum TaxID=1224302 RepID=UPI001667B7E9|nr:transporter substrate-binding domain-containing protein [Undibacterium terreum]